MKVSEYITWRLQRSGKTQAEVARDVGFSSPNIVSMLKTGKTKVPLNRVPALADTLEVPPQQLLLLCLRGYEPELMAILEEVFPGILLSPKAVELFRRYKSTLILPARRSAAP